MKLPVVTEETEDIVQRELAALGPDVFTKDLLVRLRKENPTVAGAIVSLAALSGDDRMTSMCAAMVYRLLEEQSMQGKDKEKQGGTLH